MVVLGRVENSVGYYVAGLDVHNEGELGYCEGRRAEMEVSERMFCPRGVWYDGETKDLSLVRRGIDGAEGWGLTRLERGKTKRRVEGRREEKNIVNCGENRGEMGVEGEKGANVKKLEIYLVPRRITQAKSVESLAQLPTSETL